jgi:hypothetical protein
VRGSAGVMSMARGHLQPARFCLAKLRTLSKLRLKSGVTSRIAATACPHFSSSIPMTATLLIIGCRRNTFSSSTG